MVRSSQFDRIEAFPLLTGKSNRPSLTTEQKYIAYKVAQMKELDMAFLRVKPMVIERDILNISLARKVDGRRMTRVQSRHINFA